MTLAREAVADLIDLQDADLIKIAIEAGFDRDYTDEGWPVLSPEEVRAITGAAHERGRKVYAHVSQPLELRAAVDAGVDVAALNDVRVVIHAGTVVVSQAKCMSTATRAPRPGLLSAVSGPCISARLVASAGR